MTTYKDPLTTLKSKNLYVNKDTSWLFQYALAHQEGIKTTSGALSCLTGKHTGRSPEDKYIIQEALTKDVDWGRINHPLNPTHFNQLYTDQLNYLQDQTLFVRDAFAGADKTYQVPIRIITNHAWANLFCKHLFIRPEQSQLTNHNPRFTIIHTPSFLANPKIHGTKSETFIVLNFSQGLILIGGTEYAGEIKKSIFSVVNFLYPQQNVLPMHCSATVDKNTLSNTALFFGLSGTGKTTLSADPRRRLIGDDEHGWSDQGIFNIEGGCYAKCANLSEEKEPQIWHAIRDGAILENVLIDPNTGIPDYNDTTLTENTRAAYPIEYIDQAICAGTADHPQTIVLLTCDAFGVMPPIAKLTKDQAMYHFLSGYTAKVAGTEQGSGSSPQATFSPCFAEPFLPLKATVYSELLGQKMADHKVNCWLVNTGWIGGSYGIGERIKLDYTRNLVNSALNGSFNNVGFNTDPIFGFLIPQSANNIPENILDPSKLWQKQEQYQNAAKNLAGKFKENFKRFTDFSPGLSSAGPRI